MLMILSPWDPILTLLGSFQHQDGEGILGAWPINLPSKALEHNPGQDLKPKLFCIIKMDQVSLFVECNNFF